MPELDADFDDLAAVNTDAGQSLVPGSPQSGAVDPLAASREAVLRHLPLPYIDLSEPERGAVEAQRGATLILGAAGCSAMTCRPECPFRLECSLYLIHKHPLGQPCPFEIDLLRERFLAWLGEFGRTLDTLLASERITISSLCHIELDLWRVRKVLSQARNAELNQVSVKQVDEDGAPMCWENVIHTAAQQEMALLTQLRMLLKDYELTPESKTRRAKALGVRPGRNIATQQSELFDRIRARRQGVIDVPVSDVPVSDAAPADVNDCSAPVGG